MLEVNAKQILSWLLLMSAFFCAHAQQRRVQNKPYIDLRPLHFGILVGTHLQDVELQNVGPQIITDEEGQAEEYLILTDADRWNPGFSVGVVADWRISSHLSLRLTPAMHFGAKHLTFADQRHLTDGGLPQRTTQDLKNTYVSLPVDLKFSAPRWNNYRPYLLAGVSPMLNLTGSNQDYVQLKRYSTMLEVGVGCDFYLPFFKLIPELKFCYGLGDSLDKGHVNELRDTHRRAYTRAVSSAHTKMVMLTFYFE